MEKLKALLLLIIAVIFFSCKMDSDNNSSKFAPDIVSIMNFTNYSSIGVASKSVTSSRSARAISTNAVDILVGINKNTELLEKVSFISSDDSESDSDFNVCAYQDTTPFLFIQFSKTPTLTQGYFNNNTGENFSPIYAISKSSGKIYNLGEISFSNHLIYNHNMGSEMYMYASIAYSDTSVFVSECNLDTEIKYVYKIIEENEKLKFEKYCRDDALGDIAQKGAINILSDKYGNLLETDGKYLTKNKEMKTSSRGWLRSYDGLLYNGNSYIDENGNICTGTFAPNYYYIFSDDELLFSDGLENWYYGIDDANSSKKTGTGHFRNPNGIYKVTFTDSTKSQFDGELIREISNEAIKVGRRFFFLDNGKISYYDYISNNDAIINIPNCTVTSIEENVGGLIYKGYGSDLISTVEGFINAETLEVSDTTKIDSTLFTPIYLVPLN
ncbi:MAG: hypothetical protein SPK10_06720 [Treponema sp.]|nr:hypothetical protein [Treponema sp.]MDY5764464.1 hypothetical protein [Treponema sp.]